MESKTLEFAQGESRRSWLSPEDWMESKVLEFARRERVGSRAQLNLEAWLELYLYIDLHEIFFVEFPIVPHEWLSILARRQTNFQRREVVEWSDQLVHEVTSVSNTISRVVDFWVESILQGYITKFAVEAITSYSEAERIFIQGPQRRYLLSLSTWIKMFIYEKGILKLIS